MIANPLSQLHLWCLEAVNQFGDDWGRIQLYVHEKLALLTEQERTQFLDEVTPTLGGSDREHIH